MRSALLLSGFMTFLALIAPSSLRAQEPGAFDRFSHVFLDAQSVRGGNGDVAPAYLFAADLLQRHGFKGKLTIVVTEYDERTREGATKKSGISILKKIVPDFERFTSRVDVTYADNVKGEPKADLFVSFAGVNGELRLPFAWSRDFESKEFRPNSPFTDKTVFFSYSVFGNTENTESTFSLSTINFGKSMYVTLPPGLGEHENGIYFDPSAARLRDMTRTQLRAFIQQRLGEIESAATRESIAALTSEGAQLRVRTGFAYGITIDEVKGQFWTYVRGIRSLADTSPRPTVIITPSAVNGRDLPIDLADRVELLRKDNRLPDHLEAGKIYVLQIASVKNDMFNALMAYSELPAIVSGDNALSAAVTLGKPFVMTKVKWNAKNIEALLERLERLAVDLKIHGFALLKEKLMKADLSVVLDLGRFRPAFRELSASVPMLSDRITEVLARIEGARNQPIPDPA
ncbi:MAG TPA: hypothetical protein VFV50_17675, partial [Bdellovibrionales bacterium]|nr:hypothetical protein [Bdellovibrionales bacterium]